MTETEFLLPVIQRNTGPDGKPIDPDLMRRMEHPICVACKLAYKQKYPDSPFNIVCKGIAGEQDFKETAERTGLTYEATREVMDRQYWAEKHMKITDDYGNVVKFIARDYQIPVMQCTATHKVSRMGRGLGKMCNINSPIPSPTGWKLLGELKVGDIIFDANGLPTKVLYISPTQLAERSYEVKFSDGSIIHANDEHLWETSTFNERRASSRSKTHTKKLSGIRTTKEILDTLIKNRKPVQANHSIRLAGALHYPEKELIIPAYVLGCWLGDGCRNGGPSYTCDVVDSEIIDNIRQCGFEVNKSKATHSWSIHGLTTKLRELGVLKDKHIPRIYLESSIEQRLELLRGLMDTDGTIGEGGFCTFDNTNKDLSNGVEELVVSLGMQATRAEKVPRLNGVEYSVDYRVFFRPMVQVFRLSRKANRVKLGNSRKTCNWRYIVDIKPAKPALMKCIQVDNPDHLYLIGKSCIPTHNTITGMFEEVHIAVTNKNYPILVVAPAKSQAKKWYDDILWLANQDPDLSDSIVSKQQQPFYLLRFSNGSTISIFTAGSTSGHGADAIRSQSPRRVHMEEQDGLNEEDYKVLQPLFERYSNSEVHGAGTPTGARSMFWAMCRQFKKYKEFHVPITKHPEWSEKKAISCREEARTEANYIHEFLAEFGDPEAGVFKTAFIDESRIPYSYQDCARISDEIGGQEQRKYFMGVDWNGEGTGTRIRILEYDPISHIRRVVGAETVAGDKVTNWDTLYAIRDMNRLWKCEEIFLDYGYGAFQGGLLRDMGKTSTNTLDKKLEKVRLIDFGASLKFNRIIPHRGKPKYVKLEEEKRTTKPFMVEGAVMCLERGLFRYSEEDGILDSQLRAYRVKTWSQHGYANTYTGGSDGDHDLDAVMLALLGIELKYGIMSETNYYPKPAIRSVPLVTQSDTPIRTRESTVQSRQPNSLIGKNPRVVSRSRHSMIVVPGKNQNINSRTSIPSRTSTIRRPPPKRGW